MGWDDSRQIRGGGGGWGEGGMAGEGVGEKKGEKKQGVVRRRARVGGEVAHGSERDAITISAFLHYISLIS